MRESRITFHLQFDFSESFVNNLLQPHCRVKRPRVVSNLSRGSVHAHKNAHPNANQHAQPK